MVAVVNLLLGLQEGAIEASGDVKRHVLIEMATDAIPDQPALLRERAIARCFKAAASMDVAATKEDDDDQQVIAGAWDAIGRVVEFQEEADDDDHYIGRLVRQVGIRVAIRAILLGLDTATFDELGAPPVEGVTDPAAVRRARADGVEHVARLLAAGAMELTATGAYLGRTRMSCWPLPIYFVSTPPNSTGTTQHVSRT
jgi:hypothetical protein